MLESTADPQYFQKQPVEVEVPAGQLKGVYNTRIANLNDQALLLEVPQIGNLYLPLGVGQPFLLRYVEESWAYEVQAAVAARKDNLDLPLMLVVRPKSVTRRLLRKFVRVDTDIETSLCLIKDLKEYSVGRDVVRNLTQATMLDISGGGCRLRVPVTLDTEKKGYALLWFTLPIVHKSFYNMLTRVKTVSEDPASAEAQAAKFIIVEFTGLSETERDDIVQYCHRKQLESGKS